MTVLDASVMIAYFGNDAHTEAATELLAADSTAFRMHPVTLAEVLTGPVRHGLEARVSRAIAELGVEISRPDDDEPSRVAQLRVATALKLPDCYVLALAEQSGSMLASFDDRLRWLARQRGVQLAPAIE